MNPRYVLALALQDLSSDKAAYLSRIADDLDQRPELRERLHLLYPVLAAAATHLQPLLDPKDAADIAADFVVANAEGLAITLYSAAFITQGLKAMHKWAEQLNGHFAALIYDRLQAGEINLNEPRVWRFHSEQASDDPKKTVGTFPFCDPDDDEDDI